MNKKILLVLAISAGLIGLTGCSQSMTSDPIEHPETTVVTVPEATSPISATITVVTDPSLEEIKNKDPYAQLSEQVLEAYKPDKDLYNILFNAIDKMETTVDVSGFPLSVYEKVAVCDSLYEQAGFQFYYVNRIRLSKDGDSVLITYTDKGEEAQKNKEIFYAKLAHLIYNVAPENYSPLQKLFSVYDYIIVNADYTDDMQDTSTFTAYSILMKGKGICGGFASLGYYVLNNIGIPTDYISNEPHAWNMVKVDGKNYHTDITWGAGNYGSNMNSLRTILMDEEQRNLSLENNGFGGYEIIKGFPRMNSVKPLPATDKDFKAYYDLYFEYALDIENDRVYYYDGEGIKRMTLAGEELEIVSQMPATYLTIFNGTLYFINSDNRHLYRLQPGKEAELLDDSIRVETMNLKNAILYFQTEDGTTNEKTLNLNPFVQSNFDINSSNHQQSVTLPRQQSFKFQITFSDNMVTDVLPREFVTLVSKDGDTLPNYMYWDEDSRTLNVRSKVSLDKESEVSLYIAPGITAANGNKLKEMYDITVNLK